MTTVWLSVIDGRWLIIADLWSLIAFLLDILISALVAPNLSYLLLSCFALLIPTSVALWHHLLLSCFMITYRWLVIPGLLSLVHDHWLNITVCLLLIDYYDSWWLNDYVPLSDYHWLMITVWLLLTGWWSLIASYWFMTTDCFPAWYSHLSFGGFQSQLQTSSAALLLSAHLPNFGGSLTSSAAF